MKIRFYLSSSKEIQVLLDALFNEKLIVKDRKNNGWISINPIKKDEIIEKYKLKEG